MTKKSDAPAIRFKGFSDAWEQRKFSELVQIERGGSPRPIDDFITDAPNGLNWIKIGDAPTQGNYITKTAEKIRPEGLSKTREVHPGDLILSNSMSFGKPYIMGIDGCIHDGWLLIRNTYGVFDLTFLCHLLGTPQMLSQYRSLAAGSTVNNLNKELVGNTVVTIPSITEQRVLGDYLEQLDNLITLHQRKFEKLTNVKKSMLEKMFPQNGSSYPEIRFKGFTDPWEQRKVTEIGKIYIGLVTTMTKHYTDEGTLLIRNSDIKDGKFEFGDNPIYLEKTFAEKNETRMHQIGDVITVHTGDVGTSAVITENEAKSIGFATIVTRPNPKIIDSNYLCSFLNTDKHKKWAVSISTGDGRTNYNLGDYFELVVPVPSIAEQKKIASYIQKLNRLITLHQRQPFLHSTPEISLTVQLIHPFYTSSWEQRKFSDITFPAGEKNRDNLPLESYSITNEHGFVPQDEKFENGGTMREADKRMYYIVSPNSFAYNPARINVGSIGYQNIGKNVIVSSLYEVFKTSEDVDDRLLWHWFKSPDFQKLIMQLQEGGVRLYFYYDKLCMGEVSLPSLEEQRKIGKLFDTLDNLITLHQRKGKAAVTGCSNDANNSKGVYCKARDFGYKCYKKVKSQQIRCLIAVFIFFV